MIDQRSVMTRQGELTHLGARRERREVHVGAHELVGLHARGVDAQDLPPPALVGERDLDVDLRGGGGGGGEGARIQTGE